MSTCPNHFVLFDAIEARLTASDVPARILIDGTAVLDRELRAPVTVAEALTVLRNPETDSALSDAIWSELICRARLDHDPWQLVAVWAMTPFLRAAAWRLTRRFAVEHADAQSEILLGFLEALETVDCTAPGLSRTLWRSANRHACRRSRKPNGQAPARDLSAADRGTIDEDRLSAAAIPIHSDVLDADASPGARQVEGERLGALAARIGMQGRLCDRRSDDQLDGIVRYIRFGETRATRTARLRTCSARRVRRTVARHRTVPDGEGR